MTENKSFVFRFGDVEVREREFILVKSGEVLSIEPKAFRVLLFLLHNPQKLITKEDLLDAVWADAAVTESSLTRSIAKLRKTLGDDFQEPRYIATVTTLGYRLVCPVEVSEETSGENCGETEQRELEVAGVAAQNKLPKVAARGLRRWWLLAAAVLVAGLGAGIWYLLRPPPSLHVAKYTQITHDGRQKYPAGTDGSRLYIIQPWPATIAQVGITGGEIVPVPVSSPELGADLTDVSPDGTSFLIQKHEATGAVSSIWNVHILGGSVRRLGDGWNPVFTPDGRAVTYTTENGDIYIVRSDGSETHKLASVGGVPEDFAWAPDGSVLRFSRDGKLWEISSSGTRLHPLLADWHSPDKQCCGFWTPDGSFYLFLSGSPIWEGGQIWALDERRGMFQRPPAEPVRLTTGPITWFAPIPGKDGKSIFAAGISYRGELSRFDPQTRELKPFLGGISSYEVSFSKDGQSVAYVSFPERVLWKANRDGSNRMQLSDRPMAVFMPRWSPDGAQILFSDVSSDSQMYVVSPLGGVPRKLLNDGSEEQSDPDWSPDGHKIVFGNSLGAGNPKSVIRIFDLDTRRIAILPGSVGMTDPRWSPDGRSIAASSFDLRTLNIFDVATQRWSAFAQKLEMDYPEWSRDGQFIYFMHPEDAPGVYRIRVRGGEVEKVVDLENLPFSGQWVNGWIGLDATDEPLLLRDISSSDIYALTLEEK